MYNDTELEDYLYNGGNLTDDSIDDLEDIPDDEDLSSETDADMPE